MYDRVRDPINPMTRDLRANAATAESGDSSDSIDFLTSGIKFYSESFWHQCRSNVCRFRFLVSL